MQKSVTRPKRILEIGYGGRPFLMKAEDFAKIIPPEVEYHGLDWKQINMAEDEVSRLFREEHARAMEFFSKNPHPQIRIHNRDARNLNQETFEGGVFDEIHMHFVHTYPKITARDTRRILVQIDKLLAEKGIVMISGEFEVGVLDRVLRRIIHRSVQVPNTEVEMSMRKLGFKMKKTDNTKEESNEIKEELAKTIFGSVAFRNSIYNYAAGDLIEFMIFERK